MKKFYLSVLLALCTLAAMAQPQFYIDNAGTSANSFPLNSTTNKVQWIYAPNAFDDNGTETNGTPVANGGNPAYNGFITHIFIRLGTTGANATYTNFSVRLAQNVGTQTTWTNTTFNTGMVDVVPPGTFTLSGVVSGQWYQIPLTTPFLYDPNLSLVMEIQSQSYTGTGSTTLQSSVGNKRIWGTYNSPTASGGPGTGQANLGFNLIPAGPCTSPPTAGTSTTSNAVPCSGANFTLNVTGNSTGTGQTYTWESSANLAGPYTAISAAQATPSFVTNATTPTYYRCAVTCSGNTQYSTPVLVSPIAGLSGAYTINSTQPTGGTNFQTFAAAVAAMSCGVAGPVTFNVVAGTGPYTENVTIPSIPGVSAVNTITFNGNGNVLTSALGPSTLELNGADHIKVNNLVVNNTNATTAFAVHLWNNADNNRFSGCTMTVPIANTATTSVPFSISGSATSATTSGAAGINDTVVNCTISGGYYNTCVVGNSAAVGTGNFIANNTITEFYLYGGYVLYQNGLRFKNNLFTRPTRTLVSSTYGIYFTTGTVGSIIDGNIFRGLFESAPTSTNLCYPIYVIVDGTSGNENQVINNLIYNNNHEGVYYPIFASGADYIKIYHNTINIDHPASIATGATYGIYCTGTVGGVDVRNNIVTLNRGGTGARYCLYYTGAFYTSNRNVLYNTSTPAATNGIGFYLAAQATLANWQAVNGAVWDQQSVSVDPAFVAPIAPLWDFTPTAPALNNIGAPVGVAVDQLNAPRNPVTPDPGAIEFSVVGIDIALIGLVTPDAGGCYSVNEPVVVTVQNNGATTHDFAVNPVNFSGTVSGTISATLSGLLNTGTLAPSGTTTFTLTPTVDMSAVGSYTLSITGTVAGDISVGNNTLGPITRTVSSNAGTITGAAGPFCASGSTSLTLSGASGGTRQWQESTVSAAGPWTNVGAGGNTYTPAGPLTQTTYYQVVTTCYANTLTSPVFTVTVNNPQVLTTQGDTLCSGNTATLAATVAPGQNLRWFANATGGSPLFTGSPYVTPVLNNTTTYYAEASTGGGSGDSIAVPLANGTTTGVYHHMFRMNNTTAMTLTAIGIKCNQAINTLTAWDVYYRPDNYQAVPGANTSSAGWTLLSSATNVPSAGAAAYTIITLNVSLPIPSNSQYSFYVAPAAGTTHQYASTALGTTVVTNADAALIAGNRGSSLFNCTTNGGMATVKMIYSLGCAGTRVPVDAIVTPSPTVSVTPATTTVCSGYPVTLTASGSPATYSWTGGISNGVAFTATNNNTYTVTATDANLCTATATAVVNVNPVLTGTISASPTSFCLGGSSVITAAVTPLCAGSVTGFAGNYAPANWVISQDNSNGLVNSGGAPANIIMTSGNNQNPGGMGGTTSYSVVMGCSGTVSFNWSYTTPDIAFADRPRYQINSGPSQDVPGFNMFGASVQNGTASILVSPGDTFRLQTYTVDNDQFSCSVTYSNFSAPAAPINGTVSIWDAPTGGNNLGASPQTVTPAAAGSVSYYAEITANGTGCVNLTRVPVTLTVNAAPNVTASTSNSPSNAVCQGGSIDLIGANAATYSWQPGNLSGSPVSITPASSGTYTLTGTDGNGCTATATVAVTVNPLPAITSLTATPDPICANGTSTLAVSPGLAGGSYCTPTVGNPGLTGDYINNFTLFTLTNFGSGDGPGDYNLFPQTTTLTAGVPYNISAQSGPTWSQSIGVWIDYNQDGDFDDAGEFVISWPATTATSLGGVTVPPTAFNGLTRLRVGAKFNTTILATESCGHATFGEYEDYNITIVGGVTPAPPFASVAWSPATFLNATNTASVTASAVTASTTYTVTGTDANGCSVTSSITLNVTPAPTGNTFGTPIVIGTLPYSTTGDNLAANCWTNAYTGLNNQSSADVFYQFVMPACNDSVNINTCTGTGFDTYIHLLDNAGNQITSNDDNCGLQSNINFSGLTPGATYYVVVEGFGTNSGNYGLSVSTHQSSTLVVAGLTASPGTTVCEGTTVTLNATGGTSYAYAGPGGPLGSNSFTATPAATGTYTVTATSAAGCTATATVSLTVNANPVVSASSTPSPATVCAGGSVTLSGSGASTYAWTDGVNTPTDNVAFVPGGSSTYTLTGTDANGCSATATVAVTVNALPTVTAGITPVTNCQNSIAVPNGGGAVSYVWTGGLTNGQPFVVASGSTTYSVTGTDGNGCTATSSVTVTGTAPTNTLPGTTANSTQNHGDDLNATYYDASCNPIANVDDGAGGNILGLTTATVTVQGTAGFHNGQPFVRRWYQITPTSNGAADVQLYITQTDFDDYNAVVTAPYLPLPTGPADLTGIANVRITKNADAGLGNSPVEITPTVSWNGSYWVLSFSTPSFSQFRVHSANPGGTPLPVTLTNFDGRKLNSSNLLEWSTSAEQNNAYFNLQYSTNGTDFTTIAKVDSKAPNGLSATKLNYSYEHNTPALGHNYYRLQQVDLDGNSTQHAKVVDLIWGANGSTVSLYPNPTKDVLNIDLYTTRVQNTTVKVLDMSGRIVKQIQARSEAGMNKLSISLGDIANGVYTVQVFENVQLSHVGKVELSK